MNTNCLYKIPCLSVTNTKPAAHSYFGTFNFDTTPYCLPGYTVLLTLYPFTLTIYGLVPPSCK